MDRCRTLLWSVIFIVVSKHTLCSHPPSPLNYFKASGCDFQLTSEDLNSTFVIGALFPIHEYDTKKSSFVLNVFGVTWVEAFLFAVDEINNNSTLLPGVKLGYDVRDTCNNEQVAKMHALDFISDHKYFRSSTLTKQVSRNTFTYFLPRDADNEEGTKQCTCFDGNESKLIGVVGGARSPITSICSHLLGAGNIPQISYASTSPSLSKDFLYPNLLRTIPSDLQQILAINELLKFMKWNYVSVLASDDTYGQLAIEILQENFKQTGICMAVEKHFNPSLPANELDDITEALKELYSESRVVIVWATDYSAISKIMDACTKKGLSNVLWAILTETWGTDIFLRENKKHRIIKLKHDNPVVSNFIHHLERVKYQSHLNNTWIRSLWRSFGFCPESGISDSSDSSSCYNIVPSGAFLTKTYHETVIASVYAFAYGLHDTLNCSSVSCKAPTNTIDYQLLLESIKQTRFKIPSSDLQVQFKDNGDLFGSAYYKFILYGTKRVEFGHWNKNQRIHIDLEKFWASYNDGRNQSTTTTTTKVRAACSYPCRPGFYMVQRTKTCCWDCIQCPAGEFSSTMNSTRCERCSDIETPNNHRNECMSLHNHRSTLISKQGLTISAISLFGVVCGIIVLFTFVFYWNTPVIKSSNREMSMLQICCIIVLFCLPITDFVPLSEATCIMQSVMFGSLHSLILALVLLKTYRLWRILQPQLFRTWMRIFLRVHVQVFVSFMLVFVLLLVLALWYTFNTPQITLYINKSEFGYVHHCGSHEPYLLYGFVFYILILSLASGFIAFRARHLPANFNEAQWIWVAMFANCITWVCLLPLHLSSTKLYQPIIVYSVNFISTFVLLVFLYGAKIRMLVCTPHLNNKALFVVSPNASVRTFTLKLKSGRGKSFDNDESETSSNGGGKKLSISALEKNRVISFSF